MADTTISKLTRQHRRIVTLMHGALPQRVVEMLDDTANDVLGQLAEAEATTWLEFSDKVACLVGGLPHDPTSGWLVRVRDSFAADLLALPVHSAWAESELAEAAE
ncbi:hypothetical protein IVB38_19325 [Bradyrhizobium sp. 38]|uniref:hypothetical protein n=1 Tax=unclassified Bradyrhizobium TaxID=2631580 RepID=UPI001FFBF987|nr:MULTISPECIES: hypothetical protein [unclassified Bradyrhizobium]MCK1338110.1 hypothetical protein [Bradyrhizobium sp. 38]MCK1782611.1 hypothetical protein [Bradyrhizobium sp. 132]